MEQENYVVVIAADHMGTGDETLGAILLKSFLFALTQQDQLPTVVLFYNSGVRMTSKSSEALEDIRNLEKAGVHIASCGTCLDYLGLKDDLAVGEVTNMYAILEAQVKAAKVIRP